MEQKTIEELQAELQEKINKLDKDRYEQTQRLAKEAEERRLIDNSEREARIADLRAKEEKHRLAKIQAEEEEKKRQQELIKAKLELEQSQNALEEEKTKYQQKLEWLNDAITKAEYVEEQSRKLKDSLIVKTTPQETVVAQSTEYPVAPVNAERPGEAVEGTDGRTPDTPFMSAHLRHILRQANRQGE